MNDDAVLVLGGAGVAGEAVALAALDKGARVVVPSRSADRLDRLRASTPPEHLHRLHLVVGDLGDERSALALRDRIGELVGRPRAVVASLGPWWEGAELVDVSMAVWNRLIADNLTSHFIAARTFLPMIDGVPGAVYVFLAGIAAGLPCPNAGPISVTGAGQRMLTRTLAVETIGRTVRLHEVAIMTPVVTRHWNEQPPEPSWLTGDTVGRYVAEVLSPDFAGRDRLLLEIP